MIHNNFVDEINSVFVNVYVGRHNSEKIHTLCPATSLMLLFLFTHFPRILLCIYGYAPIIFIIISTRGIILT